MEGWITHLKPLKALFFDLSSISSYSTKLDFIEWGYNRDGEPLSQLNLGMVYAHDQQLPLTYYLYPGSIVDVSTLKNTQAYLAHFGLKDFLFVLDKGFFSQANLREMMGEEPPIDFLIPLPFSLNITKELLRKHCSAVKKIEQVFAYGQEILHHLQTDITLKDKQLEAHLFYNEKIDLSLRHRLLRTLLQIEEQLQIHTFETFKAWKLYRDEHLHAKYHPFFKWNKSAQKAQRNMRKIKAHFERSAFYILGTNRRAMRTQEVLCLYRSKDLVEKVFDILKNEMDAQRLRTHKEYTTKGKLFVMFIALIIYAEISRTMKEQQLFKNYSVKELLYELRKIKINFISSDGKPIISEISKKQRTILKKFGLKNQDLHGY